MLRLEPAAVVRGLFPVAEQIYTKRGWSMFDEIDRVYVSERAVSDLGWRPRWDFSSALLRLERGENFRSPLSRSVGSKGYHETSFEEGPYPVDS